MARLIRFIFLLLVFVVGVAFTLRNAHPVKVDYYLGTAELPLSLLLVIALALGAVLGLVAGMAMVVRQRRRVAELRKAMGRKERELANLKLACAGKG
ncbi:MAG: LapA family protein [Gammaproteobacteria bacterium]|nr:MAG: LapA family protein [Gammaproteobacteria bacterium]